MKSKNLLRESEKQMNVRKAKMILYGGLTAIIIFGSSLMLSHIFSVTLNTSKIISYLASLLLCAFITFVTIWKLNH